MILPALLIRNDNGSQSPGFSPIPWPFYGCSGFNSLIIHWVKKVGRFVRGTWHVAVSRKHLLKGRPGVVPTRSSLSLSAGKACGKDSCGRRDWVPPWGMTQHGSASGEDTLGEQMSFPFLFLLTPTM